MTLKGCKRFCDLFLDFPLCFGSESAIADVFFNIVKQYKEKVGRFRDCQNHVPVCFVLMRIQKSFSFQKESKIVKNLATFPTGRTLEHQVLPRKFWNFSRVREHSRKLPRAFIFSAGGLAISFS